MAIEMTYFGYKAPNKLAENRSALSTPDTSSVAKCSRLTTSGRGAHRSSNGPCIELDLILGDIAQARVIPGESALDDISRSSARVARSEVTRRQACLPASALAAR